MSIPAFLTGEWCFGTLPRWGECAILKECCLYCTTQKPRPLACVHLCNHALKVRAVEVGTAPSVIHEKLDVTKAIVLCVLLQDGFSEIRFVKGILCKKELINKK